MGDNTFVNTPRGNKMDIEVNKVWDCPTDSVLSSVSVQLMRNGAAQGAAVTLSNANGWTHRWSDLPAYDSGGNAYQYQVVEQVPAGYIAEYTYTNRADALAMTITNRLMTYELKVSKIDDSALEKPLMGAIFRLTNEKGTALKFIQAADTGMYTLSDGEEATAELVTGADGKLVLAGLPAGTYTLTETQAPRGYDLAEPVTVTLGIGAEGTDETGSLSLTVVDEATKYVLPQTGGTGTKAYTAGGLLLMLAALSLMYNHKRKREKEDNFIPETN